MVDQQVLFDCDGRQQIPGIFSTDSAKIIPSGKAFIYISKDDENQAIYRRIQENCDISFLTEEKTKGLHVYPVPVVWLFAFDDSGNYFGTLNGIGDIEDKEFPVVFINQTTGTHGKIAENMKEFFSLANYYPYWRKIICCEGQGVPYDLRKMEEEKRDKSYVERQKEIGGTLHLSRDPDAIRLLIGRVHGDPGFVVYPSKAEAENTMNS